MPSRAWAMRREPTGGRGGETQEHEKEIMTRENAKDYLPLVQALTDGKIVECRDEGVNNWCHTKDLFFTLPPECYRIKLAPLEVTLLVSEENGLPRRWLNGCLIEPSSTCHPPYKAVKFREVLEGE